MVWFFYFWILDLTIFAFSVGRSIFHLSSLILFCTILFIRVCTFSSCWWKRRRISAQIQFWLSTKIPIIVWDITTQIKSINYHNPIFLCIILIMNFSFSVLWVFSLFKILFILRLLVLVSKFTMPLPLELVYIQQGPQSFFTCDASPVFVSNVFK